jgi:two-component system LytT family response regulator
VIRVAIADDEPLARKRVLRFLREESDVEVVAECANGDEAVTAIRRLRPDLVFLDVQMPQMGAFDVIRAVGVERMPLAVFATAYDEYAVRAFEVQALDYLLKPFSRARFQAVLKRARGQLRQPKKEGENGRDLQARLLALLEQTPALSGGIRRLLVKAGARVIFVNADEIDWIQAEGNYVRVHTGGAAHLVRQTLSRLEDDLDPARFARIHRSTLVNLDRIAELRPWFHGDYKVVLRDGAELTLSRTYREKLRGVLKQDF